MFTTPKTTTPVQQRQAGLGRHFAVSALSESPAEAAARREALRADINDLRALAQGLPDERAKHVNRQLAAAQSKLYESLWESVQAAQMDLNARGEDLSGPRGAALVQGGYLSEVDGHEFDVVHGEMPARIAGAFAGAVGSRAWGPARAAAMSVKKPPLARQSAAVRRGEGAGQEAVAVVEERGERAIGATAGGKPLPGHQITELDAERHRTGNATAPAPAKTSVVRINTANIAKGSPEFNILNNSKR